MAEAEAADPAAAVEAALEKLATESRLAVAVSGGGDSMALLAIAMSWARRRGRVLSAVTVDHRLRPASAGEAAFVGAWCARRGIPHRTLEAGPMPPGNLSAAAREVRYQLIARWAHGARVAVVLLGHTLDDQAETVLMRLARGSGVEGLAAMAPRREWHGIVWARPMLGVRRAALREWLSGQGIAWVDDPTNEDPAYDRVRARRALAALGPLGINPEGLAQTAMVLGRQRRVLVRVAAETAASAVRWGHFGEARLVLAPLRAAERDTALRIFAETLVRVAGRAYRPRFRSVDPALARLLAGTGGATTLGGCLVVPDLEGTTALICREPAAVAMPVPLADVVVWDGRWRLSVAAGGQGVLPDSLHVGALDQAGCDRLVRAARAGEWDPASEWSDAPRPVRETVPAIFADATAGAESLLAVPSARWIAPGAPAGAAEIAASPVRWPDALP